MVRWQPGARDRLLASAVRLFSEQGFEQTTVSEIADAAGVTDRTFFRHFSDKREVLFSGQADFERIFTDAVVDAPPGTSAHELIRAVMVGADSFFTSERRSWSVTRSAVIAAEPSLQERELLKLAKLKVALAAAFGERGVGSPAAELAAETAVGVFHLAFAQWVRPEETRSLPAIADELLGAMRPLLA
jgi:AcrR family transcriptional regulator